METMASQQQLFFGSLLYAISLVWTLSVLYTKEKKKINETYWMVIVLVLPFLGFIIYLLKHYTSEKKAKFATS